MIGQSFLHFPAPSATVDNVTASKDVVTCGPAVVSEYAQVLVTPDYAQVFDGLDSGPNLEGDLTLT